MATSQNGWSANDRSVIASYTIPRTQQKIAIRKGDVSVILLDLLGWIHLNIEPLDVGILDDWGYAERTIRGDSTTLSNHASGTAVDANATQHPLAATGTWSAEEKRLIHGRLGLYEGCIRWGEDYDGRVDPMHFEVNRGAADCKRVADKIRGGQIVPSPTPRLPEEDDLPTPTDVWANPIPDEYTPNGSDSLPAFAALGFTLARVTWALEQIQSVAAVVSRLEAKVDHLGAGTSSPATGPAGPVALTDADLNAIAARVVKLLGAKTSA